MVKCEYDVRIFSHDNGLVIHVGCKSFVVAEKDIDTALADVKSLLTGGYDELKRLRKIYLPNEDIQNPLRVEPEEYRDALVDRC
jgi:hypothetical protein